MNNMNEPRTCKIKEQVIHDPVSGLTFQFEVTALGETSMKVFGESLTLGNRDFAFDESGNLVGRGTATVGPNFPTFNVRL